MSNYYYYYYYYDRTTTTTTTRCAREYLPSAYVPPQATGAAESSRAASVGPRARSHAQSCDEERSLAGGCAALSLARRGSTRRLGARAPRYL